MNGISISNRFSHRIPAGLLSAGVGVALSLMAGTVAAQSFEIQPIGIDISDDPSGGLVLAAFDPSDAAPLITGLGGGATVLQASVVTGNLPQPSIILGRIAPGQEASFGIETLLPETVAQFAFSLDDLEARAALRESDPELFRQLVEEGHVDPETSQLNRTLQIELARMNCYRSGIDGAWGPGSRRSVSSYFDQLDEVSWPDQAPTPDLFRALLINGDVACPTPAPRPVATSNRSSTRTTTTRTTTRTTTTQTAPTRTPAPTTSTRPTLNTNGLRLGPTR